MLSVASIPPWSGWASFQRGLRPGKTPFSRTLELPHARLVETEQHKVEVQIDKSIASSGQSALKSHDLAYTWMNWNTQASLQPQSGSNWALRLSFSWRQYFVIAVRRNYRLEQCEVGHPCLCSCFWFQQKPLISFCRKAKVWICEKESDLRLEIG